MKKHPKVVLVIHGSPGRNRPGPKMLYPAPIRYIDSYRLLKRGHLMFVVIFRAKAHKLDTEYSQVAKRMRELALAKFGCLEFFSVYEGGNEVALSYWPDENKIRDWKNASEHLIAQELGKEKWYESYIVQVCEVRREYKFPRK